MAMRMRMDNTGKCAVYSVPDGDAGNPSASNGPFTDPTNNMSSIRFHSDFEYIPIDEVVTGTFSMPARAANSGTYAQHTLFAHGRSGIPLLFGVFPNLRGSGENIGAFGSIPVQPEDNLENQRLGYWRWMTIAADATNVYLAELALAANVGISANNLSYKVFISPLTMDSPLLPAPGVTGEKIFLSATEIRLGAGRIHNRRRYVCKDTGSNSFHYAGGRTCDGRHIQFTDALGNNQHSIDFRWSLGGVVAMKEQDTAVGTAVYPESNFNASSTEIDCL
jgi:hypothetical protein